MRQLAIVLVSVLFGSIVWPLSAAARVTEIRIDRRTPLFNGRAFGEFGAYEEIRGIATGELDPLDPRNALITDLRSAPRNANGNVAYETRFTLHKPVDMKKTSGLMVYDIANRGYRVLPSFYNTGISENDLVGDGFLYRTGNVYLWSGWQGDIQFDPASELETINIPIAEGLSGPALARFITESVNVNTRPLPGRGRTPASFDTERAQLISIEEENSLGARTGTQEISSDDWAFADCTTTPFPGEQSDAHVCLRDGFDRNRIYELVYTAKDPLVLGVGMAAIRDVVSFFRHAKGDAATPKTVNPIARKIQWTIAYGVSQSGRLAKNFLLLGFNEDEQGRIVWDGVNSNIAGAMGQLNIRFAQPGNIAGLFDPGSEAPLWWADYEDSARGRGVTGILKRCRASKTCPKIFEEFGGTEFWYGRGSVGISGTRGIEDIPLPPNVRRYYLAGMSHAAGVGGFEVDQPMNPGFTGSHPVGAGLLLARNPNPAQETRRALFVRLSEWVTKGIEPPPSAYPRVTDNTLVSPTAAAMGWPKIPGAPTPDNLMNPLLVYDFGPSFGYDDESGVIANVVPAIKQVIPTLAAQVDEDGNEVAGLKSVLLRAPLGTYTSWNPVASGPHVGSNGMLAAGYIPFARTRSERLAAGDPRPSIAERYGSQEGYGCVVRRAARDLIQSRLLLPEDADRLVAQAAATPVLPSDPDDKIAKKLCSNLDL